ncbi:MAG: hypothetical protein P4L82_22325 [Ancalomicrobiaceae bacterium]|nr:hypothetical protein [Ancalomicrobiaceae bacterium]
MFFFLCRTIGIWSLAVATVAMVIDGMKSIAAGRWILTSLGRFWGSIAPGSLAQAQVAVQHYLSPKAWDPFALWVLDLPAWIVFIVIGAIFVFLGTRRRRTVVYVT